MPMVVHPGVWARRRMAMAAGGPEERPTLSKRALTSEGFDVIERFRNLNMWLLRRAHENANMRALT